MRGLSPNHTYCPVDRPFKSRRLIVTGWCNLRHPHKSPCAARRFGETLACEMLDAKSLKGPKVGPNAPAETVDGWVLCRDWHLGH